jgi:hypothetical protein
MPLRTYECCGSRYEDLTGNTISSAGTGKCPVCGSQGKEIPSSFGFTGCLNPHLMDPVERQMLINNRLMMEQMHFAGDVDDGSYKITESGPSEFRPFGNDAHDRKKAKEEARVIQ